MGEMTSFRELLNGKDAYFDKAMAAGKVQLMRLKNIAITIDGQTHKDKNLFDLFLDHQNDGLFEDYVREHTPVNANLLMQADYVIVFVADGKFSRFAGVYQVFGEDKSAKVQSDGKKGEAVSSSIGEDWPLSGGCNGSGATRKCFALTKASFV